MSQRYPLPQDDAPLVVICHHGVRSLHVVSAPITGLVEPITLEPGDAVRRGQLITHMHGPPSAPLDPTSQRETAAALAAARASTGGMAATLAQARRDLARAEDRDQILAAVN